MLQGIDMSGIPLDCVLCVISEPAAALFSLLHSGLLYDGVLQPGEVVMTFYLVSDLGGGTDDATVLCVRQEGSESGKDTVYVEVIGLSGDNAVGGRDCSILVECMMQEEFVAAGLPIDVLKATALHEGAEALKKKLSVTQANVELVVAGKTITFAYSDYLWWTRKLRAKVIGVAEAALQEAQRSIYGPTLKTARLKLLMVGGAHQDPALMSEMTAAIKAQFRGRLDVVSPKDSMGYINSVASGAAMFAAFISGQGLGRYTFSFKDQVPRDVRINTKPCAEVKGTTRVIVERGSQLDKWHYCPTDFTSPTIKSLKRCRQHATILSLCFGEGESDHFSECTFVGKGKVPFEPIKSMLKKGQQSLPADALVMRMQSRVSSRGTLDIKFKVMDNQDNMRHLVTVPVDFSVSGCLPRRVLEPLVAAGVRETQMLSFNAVRADIDAALVAMQQVAGELGGFHTTQMDHALQREDFMGLWEVLGEIRRVTSQVQGPALVLAQARMRARACAEERAQQALAQQAVQQEAVQAQEAAQEAVQVQEAVQEAVQQPPEQMHEAQLPQESQLPQEAQLPQAMEVDQPHAEEQPQAMEVDGMQAVREEVNVQALLQAVEPVLQESLAVRHARIAAEQQAAHQAQLLELQQRHVQQQAAMQARAAYLRVQEQQRVHERERYTVYARMMAQQGTPLPSNVDVDELYAGLDLGDGHQDEDIN